MTEFGPLANPRLCVMADSGAVKYKWQVLFKTISDGEYSVNKVQVYLEQLRPHSGYKVYPGLTHYIRVTLINVANIDRARYE